jgi:hypothetical protein
LHSIQKKYILNHLRSLVMVAASIKSYPNGILTIMSGIVATMSGHFATATGFFAAESGPFVTLRNVLATASMIICVIIFAVVSGLFSTMSGIFTSASGIFATTSGMFSTASGLFATSGGKFLRILRTKKNVPSHRNISYSIKNDEKSMIYSIPEKIIEYIVYFFDDIKWILNLKETCKKIYKQISSFLIVLKKNVRFYDGIYIYILSNLFT